MYIPGISDVLEISPITAGQWFYLLGIALTLLVVEELHKLWLRRRNGVKNVVMGHEEDQSD